MFGLGYSCCLLVESGAAEIESSKAWETLQDALKTIVAILVSIIILITVVTIVFSLAST